MSILYIYNCVRVFLTILYCFVVIFFVRFFVCFFFLFCLSVCFVCYCRYCRSKLLLIRICKERMYIIGCLLLLFCVLLLLFIHYIAYLVDCSVCWRCVNILPVDLLTYSPIPSLHYPYTYLSIYLLISFSPFSPYIQVFSPS